MAYHRAHNHRKKREAKTISKTRKREGITGYLFMIPTLIGVLLYIIYPLIAASIYSFTDWNGVSAPNFVGFANYVKILTKDPLFFASIKATFLYVIWTVPLGLAAGLLLALLLNKRITGIKVFRTIFYLPCVLPIVATLVMFKFFFSSDSTGVANQLLAVANIAPVKWLFNVKTIFPSLTIMHLWASGATMVLFLAGLQSVPADLYEAADIDGAGGVRKFFNITVPVISPIIVLQLLTGLIAGIQVVNQALLLTQGKPRNSTMFFNYLIYTNAFESGKWGYSMALLMFLFVITVLISFPVFKISDMFTYYESKAD